MSGIDALNIAKGGLLSHQTAINVTGTNIANANTEGYSRQRATFSALEPSVEISGIERIYDQFLSVQINEQSNSLGDSETKKDVLETVEMIFNETDGGGINEILSEFWNAWEDLSANPSGQAERLALVSVSQSLASLFRSYGDDLLSAQNDANARIATLVDEVNGYVSDIADINENIMRCGPDVSNDSEINNLKDTRETLLTSLAGIVDIHYITNEDDSISIFMSNGIPLVDGNQSWSLDVVGSGQTSFYDVVFADDPSASINDYLTKGSLAACIELRDTTVAGYIDSFNALAASVVDQVNSQHSLGYDLNQDAGGDFFFFDVDPEVENARYMKVSTEITDDINKIAASATVNGDGDNAASIGAIKDELVMNGGTSTLSAYYSSIVGQVGQDAAYANRSFEHNTDLMTQLTNKREGISGVSIDEEMLNLIKYQTGYNASAKLFTLTEELIDTLIGLVE